MYKRQPSCSAGYRGTGYRRILETDQRFAVFDLESNRSGSPRNGGGALPEDSEAVSYTHLERKYGLTFVGTMGDYFSQVLWIHGLERPKRFLANRFLLIMRQHPELTLEQAFARAVEHQRLKLTDQEFLDRLRELCVTGYCVMHYYREMCIRDSQRHLCQCFYKAFILDGQTGGITSGI